MFIQGNLQAVFDALYTIGAIDPVLHMDWEQLNSEMNENPQKVVHVCQSVNACRGDQALLIETLKTMDQKSLYYVALEVAREYSEFQDRKELH
ncbi:MAG: cytochrome [Bdellovibrio sp.]|nr:cytochrome [Bdellovibrio sp.]